MLLPSPMNDKTGGGAVLNFCSFAINALNRHKTFDNSRRQLLLSLFGFGLDGWDWLDFVWIGLDWDWLDLDWFGLGLVWVGLIGFGWIDWIGLDWDCLDLDWIWIGLG